MTFKEWMANWWKHHQVSKFPPSFEEVWNAAYEAGIIASRASEAAPVAVGDVLTDARIEVFATEALQHEAMEFLGSTKVSSHDNVVWAIRRARAALASQAVPKAIPVECDVRNILLKVVPGMDGCGHEVYAKNVAEVEQLLSEMGERLETLALGLQSAPSATAAHRANAGTQSGEKPTRGTLDWLIAMLLRIRTTSRGSIKIYMNDANFGRVEVGGALYGMGDIDLTANDDAEGAATYAPDAAKDDHGC